MIPIAKQATIDWKKVDRFKNDLPQVIKHIDEYFLKDKQFIGGDKISVADLMAACELMQLYPIFEENIYMSNPKVVAWMGRVREELNPYFDEGHAIIYRTRESFKKLAPKLDARL